MYQSQQYTTEQDFLEFLKNHPGAKVTDFARYFTVSRQTAWRKLGNLEFKKLVRVRVVDHCGRNGPTNHYFVRKPR